MVNWRSEVNTPLRLNGRTIRSASTPSTASRSTMPSGWASSAAEAHALAHEIGAHVLRRSRAPARTACDALACKSAVISRASSSTSPAPISAIVWRSLENEGSIEVELRALEPFGDEDVGDEVAGAADDGIVVAAGAGIGIRAAGAGERAG